MRNKYFYCAGNFCHFVRHPITDLAIELNYKNHNKKLCKLCHDAGYRLEIGINVVLPGGK